MALTGGVALAAEGGGILHTALLSLREGAIVTSEMLSRHLYGRQHKPKLKFIDVFADHLPMKLAQATGGKHYIETIWGRGYPLRAPAQEPLPFQT